MKKETLELIEKIKIDLKEILSEYRYNHSIAVMNKAIELAKIYNEDEDKVALAGLTHDIAKEIPDSDAIAIAEKNNIKLDKIEKINTRLLHGKIGAFIVKEKYNFDEQIQKAIEYHTETSKDMDLLAKIIFVADKIEDTRKSTYFLETVRKVASEDIDQAIILITSYVIQKLIEEDKLIHPAMIETRNYLKMKNNLFGFKTKNH